MNFIWRRTEEAQKGMKGERMAGRNDLPLIAERKTRDFSFDVAVRFLQFEEKIIFSSVSW